jgi:plasmid stabilization system protein ParE
MTTPPVRFAPEALAQLEEIEQFIAQAASPALAARYVDGIVTFCESLRTFPQRGTCRNDIRPGLRITNYRRRTVIAFAIEAGQPFIIGVFYGGQNYEGALDPDPAVAMSIAWSRTRLTSPGEKEDHEPLSHAETRRRPPPRASFATQPAYAASFAACSSTCVRETDSSSSHVSAYTAPVSFSSRAIVAAQRAASFGVAIKRFTDSPAVNASNSGTRTSSGSARVH